MYKQKTIKAAAKRFKITKRGKILRMHAAGRHLLSCKSSKRKRRIKKSYVLNPADYSNIRRMLPNA